MLPLLLCAAIAGSGPGRDLGLVPMPAVPPGAARIEIIEGRAALALRQGVIRLTQHSPEQLFVGPVHMEVSARSRVRVRWSGLASLLIEGSAVVEWDPPRPSSGEIACRFDQVDRAHIEVRRGRVTLGLPHGWSADVEAGACFLRGSAGANLEFEHDAGLPISLWAPSEKGAPRPPFTLLAGSQVRLLADAGRPLALAGTWPRVVQPHGRLGFESIDRGQGERPWEGFEWPWGELPHASVRSLQATTTPLEDILSPWEVAEMGFLEGIPLDSSPRASALDLPDSLGPAPSPADPTLDAAPGTIRAAPDPGPAAPQDGGAAPPSSSETPAHPEPRASFAPFLPDFSDRRLVMTPYGARWVRIRPEQAPDPESAPVEPLQPAQAEED